MQAVERARPARLSHSELTWLQGGVYFLTSTARFAPCNFPEYFLEDLWISLGWSFVSSDRVTHRCVRAERLSFLRAVSGPRILFPARPRCARFARWCELSGLPVLCVSSKTILGRAGWKEVGIVLHSPHPPGKKQQRRSWQVPSRTCQLLGASSKEGPGGIKPGLPTHPITLT